MALDAYRNHMAGVDTPEEILGLGELPVLEAEGGVA
jgi:hypothetical protein